MEGSPKAAEFGYIEKRLTRPRDQRIRAFTKSDCSFSVSNTNFVLAVLPREDNAEATPLGFAPKERRIVAVAHQRYFAALGNVGPH